MPHRDPRPLIERSLDPAQRAPGGAPARSVTVNQAESPLAWLFARGHISARQHDAGDQLRMDYERASLGPRVTMRWDTAPVARGRRGGGRAPDPTVRAMNAKARFDDALAALGPALSDIAWRVICAGESLVTAERAMHWPARSAKLVLGIALDRLADHYRLPGGGSTPRAGA